jgi:hypothetical protein
MTKEEAIATNGIAEITQVGATLSRLSQPAAHGTQRRQQSRTVRRTATGALRAAEPGDFTNMSFPFEMEDTSKDEHKGHSQRQ